MDAQETKIFTLVLILVVVIGTTLLYFLVIMVRQQRINLELKKQNLIAELNSAEKERARIASDLHDEIAPILSAVKLKISSFELHHPDDRVQQQKTDAHLNDLLRRLREITFDLMPVTLKRKGLAAALGELVSYQRQQNNLQIDLTAEAIPLQDTYSIHLYRLVQEIIHNTIKHAEATLLTIALKRENEKIVLMTRDNGKGFDYAQKLTEGSGFGLRNLLSRVDVLSGELFIESKADAGTAYTIEIPFS